jgi:hypothetical protein
LITPSTERELRKQILTFSTGSAKVKSDAIAQVQALGLGRFLSAAVTHVTQGGKDELFMRSAWELVAATNAREVERSARN